MQLPKVLVLLAARNGARWIEQQIESVLIQEGVDVSVIVSDDCSTDDTLQILGRYALNDRRVRIHARGVPSGSAAQNFFSLIDATPVEDHAFVAFSDQDDIWHPDKLSRGCQRLADSEASGYSSAVTAFWGDGREMVHDPAGKVTASDYLFESAGQGCTYMLSASFYRRARSFLGDHRQQTESLGYHDWTVYALCRVWGLRWEFDRRPSMVYRQHSDNDTGARYTRAGLRRRLALITGGWYAAQIRAVAIICRSAAPSNRVVSELCAALALNPGVARRVQVAAFCLKGGRRRLLDQGIVVGAALAGWI